MPLKKKLIVLFISFTLVPLVLFGAVVFSQARNILKTVRMAQLNNIADLKKDKIETFFHERIADIMSVRDMISVEENFPLVVRYSDRDVLLEPEAVEEAIWELPLEESLRDALRNLGAGI